MKFVYLGAFRLPNLDAAAPRVLSIAKMLRRLGHSVEFIAWGGQLSEELLGSDGFYYVEGFRYNISNELEIINNQLGKFKQWLSRGNKSLELLVRRMNDIDVIIAYQPSYFFLRKLRRLCRKYNKKLIVDITEWYDNKELRIIDRPFNYLNMAWELKKVKNKILISSYLSNYYHESHNIIIPATTDLSESKWTKKSVYNFPIFNGLTFIYAGTPTFKDKLNIVVETLNRIINEGWYLRFYIFGVTKEAYQEQYPEELSDMIYFMGRVSQDDIPAYYQQADFMILLRDKTRKNMMGFPTKFSEAFSVGLPIICNATSDINHYLINGENGYLIPEPTSELLYNTIINILTSDYSIILKQLKQESKFHSNKLDYNYFIEDMKIFLDGLLL